MAGKSNYTVLASSYSIVFPLLSATRMVLLQPEGTSFAMGDQMKINGLIIRKQAEESQLGSGKAIFSPEYLFYILIGYAWGQGYFFKLNNISY